VDTGGDLIGPTPLPGERVDDGGVRVRGCLVNRGSHTAHFVPWVLNAVAFKNPTAQIPFRGFPLDSAAAGNSSPRKSRSCWRRSRSSNGRHKGGSKCCREQWLIYRASLPWSFQFPSAC
jgi:hypothetical protein